MSFSGHVHVVQYSGESITEGDMVELYAMSEDAHERVGELFEQGFEAWTYIEEVR